MKTETKTLKEFFELDITKVYPNPDQPRKNFNDIEELASTIKYHGLINPITVVKSDLGYMIVSGERRYKAHLINHSKTIKANIIDVDEFKLKELVLIENIQREDLSDFEKAKYIAELWTSGKYEKKSHLAVALGKSPSYISKCFSCLKLDETILEDLENNITTAPLTVLEEISRIKDKNIQCDVYEKYVTGEIVREDIKNFKTPEPKITENFPGEINLFPDKKYNKYDDGVFEIVEEKESFTKNILVSFGFGTKNEFGSYITLLDGDFTGVFKLDTGGDTIKTTNSKEYKITIEQISLETKEK